MTGDESVERHQHRMHHSTPLVKLSAYSSSKMTVRLWIGRLLALGLVVSAIFFMWRVYAATGLFISLGMDYGLYLAQATVMGGDDPTQIYNKSTTNVVYRHLLDLYGHDHSYNPAAPGNWAAHVPYPPIFAWLMQPFAQISPPVSLLMWGTANAILALWIGWRVASHCPGADKPTVALLFLGSYPVILNLHVGQIQIVLAWAITECYLALRAGNDFRAGLWLGCVLLKPHYGLLIGPLLLWKCRWRAVWGVVTTGSAILSGSILVGGMSTILSYPQAFTDMVQFRGDSPIVMVNWRSVVLDLYPSIYWRSGIILTVILGIATIVCVAWIWRGSWSASAADFPVKMLLTLLATIIVNYHSHPYGAAILVMPLVAVLFSQETTPLDRSIVALGAFVPSIIFTNGHFEPLSDWEISLHLEFASQILKATVVALFAHTFLSLSRMKSVENESADVPRINVCVVRLSDRPKVSTDSVVVTPYDGPRASNG